MRIIIIICIATVFLFQSCLTESDPDLKKDFISLVPQEIGDGWQISTGEAENINSIALKDIYISIHSDADLWQLRSLLVFRNNKLVAESYMKEDNDRTKQRAIWSCTKQVMGILVGIAIEKGFISSLDDPIKKYLPDEIAEHPEKSNITIRNLLTMRSGIGFNNDEHSEKYLGKHVSNSVNFILSLPKVNEQGTVFNYNDGDPHLISAILQKVTGKPTDQWAHEVLFSKINVTNYKWHRYIDGITFGGFGILMPPRELAKVASCVLSKGIFNNKRITSESWIQEMTSVKTQNDKFGFGYYWWKDTSKNISFMWGHGGQFAFIVPNKNLIVVFTSEPNTQDKYQLAVDKALLIVDKTINSCY